MTLSARVRDGIQKFSLSLKRSVRLRVRPLIGVGHGTFTDSLRLQQARYSGAFVA